MQSLTCSRVGPRVRVRNVHTRVLYTPRTRINMYRRAARVQPTSTLAIARSRRAPSFRRLSSLCIPPALVTGPCDLQTFAYKYTGYLNGWYAD